MRVLTWNVQATQGCDGRFDIARTTTHIKQYGDLDVICLQEVSRNIPDLNGDDQLALFKQQFAGYEAVWAPGFSVSGAGQKRSEFGNLTLVRNSILVDARIHSLPSPAVPELQLSRTVAETVIAGDRFQITLFNAHLAFHSSHERVEQIRALTRLRDQIISKSLAGNKVTGAGPYRYTDASQAVILCGDLNVGSETSEFKTNITDRHWIDCWTVQQSQESASAPARQPTCGCHDHVQWPEGAHVRDFFLVTENIVENVGRVEVNVETDASDHQPVLLEIRL